MFLLIIVVVFKYLFSCLLANVMPHLQQISDILRNYKKNIKKKTPCFTIVLAVIYNLLKLSKKYLKNYFFSYTLNRFLIMLHITLEEDCLYYLLIYFFKNIMTWQKILHGIFFYAAYFCCFFRWCMLHASCSLLAETQNIHICATLQ